TKLFERLLVLRQLRLFLKKGAVDREFDLIIAVFIRVNAVDRDSPGLLAIQFAGRLEYIYKRIAISPGNLTHDARVALEASVIFVAVSLDAVVQILVRD